MPPATVFIVPYRDRAAQKATLERVLAVHLSQWEPGAYEVVFVHQCDARPFNRGAMKNIGAIWAKRAYPDTYDDTTLVFHDVDTWPRPGSRVTYAASPGAVSHYYGFEFSLGGIVAIKGKDFDRTGGFPNLWGWGLEDNAFLDRCIESGLHIDRSNLHSPRDPLVARGGEPSVRTIAVGEAAKYCDGGLDSAADITNLRCEKTGAVLNVITFSAGTSHRDYTYRDHDVRAGPVVPVYRGGACRRWDMVLHGASRRTL